MSANEVRSLQRQQLRQLEDKQKVNNPSNETIQVFGSSDVGARVSLLPDDVGSLFERADLFTNLPQTSGATIDVLPKEFSAYKDEHAEALKRLTPEQLEQAKKFTDTKMPGTNIAAIVQMFSPEQCDKIHQDAIELEELSGGKDKVMIMGLAKDKYDSSGYTLSAYNTDRELRTCALDKNLALRSVETLSEHTPENGNPYRIQEAYDIKNNTVSKVRYDAVQVGDPDPKTGKVAMMYQPTYEIRSKLNDDGTMISREYSRPSSVKGVNTVDVLTEEGLQTVSSGRKKKNGKVVVQKEMVSVDGTKTIYKYKDDPKGNRYLQYRIVTKDGEELMNNTKTFTVVSDNEFKSTFNKKSYTMKIQDNKLVVTNDNNDKETATFDLGAIAGDKDKIIRTLKRMSGEELIELSESTNKLEGMANELESYFMPGDKSLHSGDNLFVVLHELGHAKDYKNTNLSSYEGRVATAANMISSNPEIIEVYNQEKEAFTQAFPELQREHIDYFINTLTHYGGSDGGIKETVAESNAIHTTPLAHELLSMRTQYLQQYFPRTFAKLNEVFQNNPKQAIEKPKIPEIKLPELRMPKIELPKASQ